MRIMVETNPNGHIKEEVQDDDDGNNNIVEIIYTFEHSNNSIYF